MPISRVRSVTLTSMMFMIPTPPTNSDTLAIAANSAVITPVMIPKIRAISALSPTEKSFG